jgi:DNA polymerase-3 subunit delta'
MDLAQRLAQNPAHAYLIVGATSPEFVRQFVQRICCPTLCKTCPHCTKLAHNTHPDLMWVSKSGKRISIDQVRDLQQKAFYPPVEAPKKIYVIESVEDLSLEAANSLLKILEAPPRYLIFMLLAKSSNILPTILSRCQIVKLPTPPRREIERRLRERGLTEPEIEYLLSLTKGLAPDEPSLESAKRFLEERQKLRQQLAGLPDGELWGTISQKDIFVRREALLEALRRLKDWNAAHVLSAAATLSKCEPDVIESFVRETTYWYRDLLAIQHSEDVFNRDHISELRLTRPDGTRLAPALQTLETTLWKMQRNANAQLLLESLLFTLRAAQA